MFIFNFSKSVYYHCLKLTRVYNHEIILEPLNQNFSSAKLYNEDFFYKTDKIIYKYTK